MFNEVHTHVDWVPFLDLSASQYIFEILNHCIWLFYFSLELTEIQTPNRIQ